MWAKNPAAAKRSDVLGLHLGWIYSAVIFIAFHVLPRPRGLLPPGLFPVFEAARPIAIFMVRRRHYVIIEVLLVIYGRSAPRAKRDTVWVMIAMSIMNWSCAFLWLSAYVFKFSTRYNWLAVVLYVLHVPRGILVPAGGRQMAEHQIILGRRTGAGETLMKFDACLIFGTASGWPF